MSLILEIPTINDKPKDFDCLSQLWQKVQAETEEVIFDFSDCHFLRQNAVAFLGGLARLIESRDCLETGYINCCLYGNIDRCGQN